MAKPTRQHIVDKMSELLETQGYHATGLNQVVQESNAPRGSLYYYFPDGKEELASEAILMRSRDLHQNVVTRLAEIDDPIEAIYQFMLLVANYVVQSNSCGGAPLAGVTLESPTTGERLRKACKQGYANIRQPFAQKLVAGGYSAERAARLATMIVAALDGGTILCRAEQSAEPLHCVAEEIKLLLQCAGTQQATEDDEPSTNEMAKEPLETRI